MEERPYETRDCTRSMGRSSVLAECPFCGSHVVIYLWSIAGNGKKLCACGAALHADRIARKLVEQVATSPRKTVAQCKSCPWRVDCEPDRDIPNYDRELACGLRRTIRSGVDSIASVIATGKMHIMACHYSKPGEEFACAGWLHNQLGPGNNLAVRLRIARGDLPVPEVDGEQHETYEATLCSREEAVDPSNHREPGRDADGEPGNTSE
jgi:hypothetical protein